MDEDDPQDGLLGDLRSDRAPEKPHALTSRWGGVGLICRQITPRMPAPKPCGEFVLSGNFHRVRTTCAP
jgi:hypothetical protein